MMVPDGLMLMIEYGAQNRISSRSIQYLGIYLILIEGYRSPAHGQLAYQWQARNVIGRTVVKERAWKGKERQK